MSYNGLDNKDGGARSRNLAVESVDTFQAREGLKLFLLFDLSHSLGWAPCLTELFGTSPPDHWAPSSSLKRSQLTSDLKWLISFVSFLISFV